MRVRILVCAALALASGVGVSNVKPALATSVDPSLLVSFPSTETFCVDCSGCFIEGEVGHKANPGDASSIYNPAGGSHTHCVTTGLCADKHPITFPNCEGTGSPEGLLASLESLRSALVSGEMDRAIAIADASDEDGIEYVSERNAIQVAGCNGELIAHLPVH